MDLPFHDHRVDDRAAIVDRQKTPHFDFAGTAIEQGIETISVADVNDPALLVAKEQGRTDIVIVMDDNVRAEAYWPCFQEIAARLP